MANESYTAYDDVFRTIVNDCSRLVLHMLNELFASEYNGNELIVKTENEIFLHKQDGEEENQQLLPDYAIGNAVGLLRIAP